MRAKHCREDEDEGVLNSQPNETKLPPTLNYPKEKHWKIEPTLNMRAIIKSKRRGGAGNSRSRGDRAKKGGSLLYHFMATTEEGVLELRSQKKLSLAPKYTGKFISLIILKN